MYVTPYKANHLRLASSFSSGFVTGRSVTDCVEGSYNGSLRIDSEIGLPSACFGVPVRDKGGGLGVGQTQ